MFELRMEMTMSTVTFETSVAQTESRGLVAAILAFFRKSTKAVSAQSDAWYAVARGL